MLREVPYRVLHLGEVGPVVFPPEGESSYAENALGKARAVATATGMLALADDSGLEVDALDGRPGVLSARYGGEGLSDSDRCVALLQALGDVPAEGRGARFRSVVAVCSPSGREATAEGVVEGTILTAPRGRGGFGYDPLFYYLPLGATFAELPPESKDAVSHRGRAMRQARRILQDWAKSART